MIKPLKTIEWIIILFGVILLIDGVIDFINYFEKMQHEMQHKK